MSIRLSAEDHDWLRRQAVTAGITISDVVRGIISRAMAEPLPEGMSIGSQWRVNEGIVWPDGTCERSFTTTTC